MITHNYVQKEFKDYIDNNINVEVSASVLWDSAKSVIRGKLIVYTSYKKKERDKKLTDLQKISKY